VRALQELQKRHGCPICGGSGRLTDSEREILRGVLDQANWANDWRQHIEMNLAMKPVTAFLLLVLGTAVGALAAWILVRMAG
jgi:hypothetical protein